MQFPLYLFDFTENLTSFFLRLFADKVICHFAEIGKKPPVFQDAAQIAQAILAQDYDFGELYFNRYK